MLVIPELGRLIEENSMFEVRLGYHSRDYLKKQKQSWVWRHIPTIPALRRLRQED
jgi:hypothetical protein